MSKKERVSRSVEHLSPLEIAKVALGVRFEPQFAITDKVGGVLDRILRSSNTPFGPTTFPAVRSNPFEHVLVNDDSEESLVLTHRDAILEMAIDSRRLEAIQDLSLKFDEFVLENLRNLVKLKNIERHGVLFKLKECRSELAKTPIQHYLNVDFENARSLILRFTRRLPSPEAHVKKHVDDYRNAIYTIQQSDDGQVEISVDYQQYFKPSLSTAEWKDKPFPRFVADGIGYFEGEFNSWLEKLLTVSEVA